MISSRPGSTVRAKIFRVEDGRMVPRADTVVTEEPLEIRVETGRPEERASQTVSVTMRTPGHDFELAAGFLFTEGIIRAPEDVESISYCVEGGQEQHYNIVSVALRPWVAYDPGRLQRNFYAASGCGICGKSSLEAVRVQVRQPPGDRDLQVSARVIEALPDALRQQQRLFQQTGGLHAAWLCEHDGTLVTGREDVGRHNALDKLIGEQLLARRLPLAGRIVVLSGRAGFELLQKAAMAGAPVVAAVGAPSSLAVDLAQEVGITLVGFVRREGFNVYSCPERIRV